MQNFFHKDGGDDDNGNGNGQQPDPVVDANDLGAEGTRFGEGHDPVEDEVL